MITIITGVPGMGKTALLVQMLLQNEKSSNPRPVFIMGIPDLKIDHSPAPPVDQWTQKRADKDDPSLLLDYFTFPPNSYLIVDEAQRVFRPRSSTSKVPPHVAALETHRHTGLDIILLTQKPSLLDINVRQLCGRHIHIRDSLIGRRLYEWPEYNDTDNKSNLDAAVKRKFSPPKESFKYYKSSELHTKQSRRFHQAYVYLFAALFLMFYMGYRTYNNFWGNKSLSAGTQKTEQSNTVIPEKNISLEHSSKVTGNTEPIPNPDPAFNISNSIHPYSGFIFVIYGGVTSAKKSRTYYHLEYGDYGLDVSDQDLQNLGYSIKQVNACTAFLIYNDAKIVATCYNPRQQPDNRESPDKAPLTSASGVSGGDKPPDADSINVPRDTVGLLSPVSPLSKY